MKSNDIGPIMPSCVLQTKIHATIGLKAPVHYTALLNFPDFFLVRIQMSWRSYVATEALLRG